MLPRLKVQTVLEAVPVQGMHLRGGITTLANDVVPPAKWGFRWVKRIRSGALPTFFYSIVSVHVHCIRNGDVAFDAIILPV